MIKYFLRVAILLCFALTIWAQTTMSPEDLLKMRNAIIDNCVKSSSITKTEMENIVDKRLLPEKKSGFCFVACILQVRGIITPNHTISAEKGIELAKYSVEIAPDEVKQRELPKKIKIFEECSKKDFSTDDCDVAKLFIDCVSKKKIEYGVTTKVW